MARFVRFIFILLVLFAAYFGYKKGLPFIKKWEYFSYCDQPIAYKLGTIDPKFKVSKEDLLNDTQSAANLWNNLVGKNVFKYDDNAVLTINLVFDERQGTLTTINDSKDQVETQKKTLSTNFDEYEKQRIILEKEVKALNNEIDSWNNKGGAPKEIYNNLVKRQKSLQTKINDINAQADKLNQSTDKINKKITDVNSTVKEFNNILQDKPEEGLYIGNAQRIEIYIFESDQGYINTTAHELGHALGLAHSNDPLAIMAPVATPDVHVTESDAQEIKEYCGQHSRLDSIKNELKIIFDNIFAKINIVGNMNK